MSDSMTLTEEQIASIQNTINEIDELLTLRQGFPQAYREWNQAAMQRLREQFGDEMVDELEKMGPRQIPVNRQHRVHVFRQRLHAQRRYFTDLLEQNGVTVS